MQTYHERWFRGQGRPIGAISAKEARDRYSAGEPFCVVIRDDAGAVLGFVESGGCVFVAGFLESSGRVYLEYSFTEIDGGLFLSQALHFDYDADGGGMQTNYYFRPDGAATIERVPLGSPRGTTESTTTNVAGNWEPKPDFEGLGTLLRSER